MYRSMFCKFYFCIFVSVSALSFTSALLLGVYPPHLLTSSNSRQPNLAKGKLQSFSFVHPFFTCSLSFPLHCLFVCFPSFVLFFLHVFISFTFPSSFFHVYLSSSFLSFLSFVWSWTRQYCVTFSGSRGRQRRCVLHVLIYVLHDSCGKGWHNTGMHERSAPVTIPQLWHKCLFNVRNIQFRVHINSFT